MPQIQYVFLIWNQYVICTVYANKKCLSVLHLYLVKYKQLLDNICFFTPLLYKLLCRILSAAVYVQRSLSQFVYRLAYPYNWVANRCLPQPAVLARVIKLQRNQITRLNFASLTKVVIELTTPCTSSVTCLMCYISYSLCACILTSLLCLTAVVSQFLILFSSSESTIKIKRR